MRAALLLALVFFVPATRSADAAAPRTKLVQRIKQLRQDLGALHAEHDPASLELRAVKRTPLYQQTFLERAGVMSHEQNMLVAKVFHLERRHEHAIRATQKALKKLEGFLGR